jgi:hypothetical protein
MSSKGSSETTTDFILDNAIIHHVLFVFVMRDRPLPPPTPLSSNMREKLLREARRYDSTMQTL